MRYMMNAETRTTIDQYNGKLPERPGKLIKEIKMCNLYGVIIPQSLHIFCSFNVSNIWVDYLYSTIVIIKLFVVLILYSRFNVCSSLVKGHLKKQFY